MMTNIKTNTYYLEVGTKIVFIEGFCGISKYDDAILLYEKFYSHISKDVLKKEELLFKKLIEDFIIHRTTNIDDFENGAFGLSEAYYDAIKMFLGKDSTCLNKDKNSASLMLDNVDDDDINQCICAFLKYKRDFQILFLWPSTLKKASQRKLAINDIETKIKVFHSFGLNLNKKAFYQLFFLLYNSFDWAKLALNKYSSGFVDKIYKCSGGRGRGLINVYFVDDDLELLLDFKRETLRDYFNIGFHSAHTCDNKIEALPIARLLLNKSGFNLLCYSDFSKNNNAINSLMGNKNNNNVYSEALYINLLNGKTVLNINEYKISLKYLKWNEAVFFYNSVIIADERKRKAKRANTYNVFLRKYKYIKVKSRISNLIRKVFRRKSKSEG